MKLYISYVTYLLIVNFENMLTPLLLGSTVATEQWTNPESEFPSTIK